MWANLPTVPTNGTWRYCGPYVTTCPTIVCSTFHITHDQMQAHWDIFFPAYLGTSDPQAIAEATQRLMPYYAAKVPYIFDMVFSAPMPDAALQIIVKLF